MGSHHPIRKTVAPEIPDKLYFRIGDVAALCDVPAYVLRFWETEFPQLKPNKGGTGQRLYRRRDVEMALRIKSLLYDEGYTIPGARQVLKDAKATGPAAAPAPSETRTAAPLAFAAPPSAATQAPQTAAALESLRADMRALLAMLEASPKAPPPQRPKVETMRPRGSAPVAGNSPRLAPNRGLFDDSDLS
jgi:DNA-binding transcriptional MerR regulator